MAEVVEDGFRQTSPAPAMDLYAMGNGVGDNRSDYYRIENYATNPVADYIGVSLVNAGALADIAVDPNSGRMYAVAWGNQRLYEVNSETGYVFWRGIFDEPSGQTALAFDHSGQLYCWGSTDFLYRFDKITGEKTLVGEIGYHAIGDMVFDLDGTLYGMAHEDHTDPDSGAYLLEINPDTGASTILKHYPYPDINNLEVHPDGTMYVTRNINADLDLVELYTIDRATWDITLIGSVAGTANLGVHGLAFLPSRSPGGTHTVVLADAEVHSGATSATTATSTTATPRTIRPRPTTSPRCTPATGPGICRSACLSLGLGADGEWDNLQNARRYRRRPGSERRRRRRDLHFQTSCGGKPPRST